MCSACELAQPQLMVCKTRGFLDTSEHFIIAIAELAPPHTVKSDLPQLVDHGSLVPYPQVRRTSAQQSYPAKQRSRSLLQSEVAEPHEISARLDRIVRRLVNIAARSLLEIRYDEPENASRHQHIERILQSLPEVVQRQMLENMRGIDSTDSVVRDWKSLGNIAISGFRWKRLRISCDTPQHAADYWQALEPQGR